MTGEERVLPLVMGVLNVTPDSFSDGGRWCDPDSAIARGLELVAEGASVVDVGGESTRPGARPVDAPEEIRRVVPVVEALAPVVRVSIDTRKDEVARAAVRAGATLINDVSASLWRTAAELGTGWVAMHMQGSPETMQEAPTYTDVVAEVATFLEQRAAMAARAGVEEIWLDPGFGFGKTMVHNLSLLRHLDRIVAIGLPVLVGLSRKATIGRLHAASDRGEVPTESTAPVPTDDRLEGSIALGVWAMTQGARMIRAHDVLAAVHSAKVVAA
ncbi:dihydropteroate synthase [Rhabdothermincola sediminis]|uniref:dihydropteroate synthase n=1 Tax=Rhabdothermincola sediminis TaxID=2751370 RepID=UPI001AA0A04C|nr:dihydropteroate synthase [Rhabdothermincola sediminis]